MVVSLPATGNREPLFSTLASVEALLAVWRKRREVVGAGALVDAVSSSAEETEQAQPVDVTSDEPGRVGQDGVLLEADGMAVRCGVWCLEIEPDHAR